MNRKIIVSQILLNLWIGSWGVHQPNRFNFMTEISIKYNKHIELEIQDKYSQEIHTEVTSDYFGVDIEHIGEDGEILRSDRIENASAFLFILLIVLNSIVAIILIFNDYNTSNIHLE